MNIKSGFNLDFNATRAGSRALADAIIRKGELEAEKIRARDRGLESGLFKVGSALLLGGAYLADKAALGGTTAEGIALAEADPMQLASAANAISPNGSVDTNKVSLFKKKASGLSFDDLLTSFATKAILGV